MVNPNLSISRCCNELLLECITQLEHNNLNNTQYNRRETLEINPVPSDIAHDVLEIKSLIFLKTEHPVYQLYSPLIMVIPTDKEEIVNVISSLNSSKASGPNSILYRILFLLKNEMSKHLADSFNLSFMTGSLSVLKTLKVFPVFKKDSKLDYSNYCPTSLLSNTEKMLEKLMYKRLYTFLNNNNIIYNFQIEFRQQHSISHALIDITENIRKALDDGNVGCEIFVDLQKAFDTVDTVNF